MNKITQVIIAIVITTLLVFVVQPKLHQNIKFTDADFGFQTIETQNTDINIKNINVKNKIQKTNKKQEIIAWNKWRADLANAITQKAYSYNTKDAQIGTIYRYAFTVDKNRKITKINVEIFSGVKNEPEQELLSAITRAIEEINGTNILEFPQGTKRKKTNVIGGIKVTNRTKYIDANSFYDYELIKK